MADNLNKIKDYAHSAIDEGEEQVRGALNQAENRLRVGREQMTKWASDVNKQTHENPWPVVAGVGIGALLLGIILGKSK